MGWIKGTLQGLFAGAAVLLFILVVSFIGWIAGIFWLGTKVLGGLMLVIGGGSLLLREMIRSDKGHKDR